jgi:1-acyl-sn-glycerol-3-phosphate acyltransferase
MEPRMSQFSLLKSKNFGPFFKTQFLGAFNDNIYKNTLMLIIAFSASNELGLDVNVVLNIAAGLFILPFFLFSGIAGQVTEKYEKSSLIRKIKLLEIPIMIAAAIGFMFEQYFFLLILLFLMGTQSTFFGPAKYAILPQHLKPEQLVAGNALVEMGTFVAILMGTISAGIIMEFDAFLLITSTLVVVLAVLGYWVSRSIPIAVSSAPNLKISYNPFTTTRELVRTTRENRPIYLAIMAISWFWFLGAAYLTQFPNFSKEILNGDSSLVTLLLAIFTFGIGFGSMLCEKLSKSRVELGIVPLGALGLTIFGIGLYFSIPEKPIEAISWLAFLKISDNWALLVNLAGIGIAGGIFIVPLYAYIQERAPEKYRARTIAVVNIMNALFMVTSTLVGIVFLGIMGLSISDFFLVISIMNIVVCLYVFYQVDEFALRFVVWILSHTLYRVTPHNLEHIPKDGAAVIVCNHVSFVDALLIAGACPRPIRFVMDHNIFKNPMTGWFFRLVKAIPIAPKHQDEVIYNKAFADISDALKDGQMVCIFPEGKLTKDGKMNEFKSGIETILAKDPVPVIPFALKGLWGSFFSNKNGTPFSSIPKRFWSRVDIISDHPLPPYNLKAADLQKTVQKLLQEIK